MDSPALASLEPKVFGWFGSVNGYETKEKQHILDSPIYSMVRKEKMDSQK